MSRSYMADLNRFLKQDHVVEAWEVVGEWEFYIDNCPKKLKIKVIRAPSGSYMGVANYKIQGPGQASPYISLRPRETVEDAIMDSLMGFLDFWDPAQADEIKLVPNDNY